MDYPPAEQLTTIEVKHIYFQQRDIGSQKRDLVTKVYR